MEIEKKALPLSIQLAESAVILPGIVFHAESVVHDSTALLIKKPLKPIGTIVETNKTNVKTDQ